MRRLRFKALLPAAALAAGAAGAGAQVSSSDAPLYLVLPVGARATGQGHTLVAEDAAGSEVIWWNAAGIARQRSREAGIHHSQTVAGKGDAISLVLPTKALGVFALSVNILDLGTQEVTEEPGQPVGLILVRNVIYAGTYAIAPRRSFSAGINYKISQLRVDCTGQCGELPPRSETIRAVDAGVQYRAGGTSPFVIGAALRNQQADKRARQLEGGLSYDARIVQRYVSDVRLRLAGAVLDRAFERRADPAECPEGQTCPAPGTAYDHDIVVRVGATVVYQDRVYLRGGYIGGRGDASGPALGFGVVAGRLSFDIARAFDGLSADAGEPPTYFSLRFVF
jgi:hypothetical protein